MEVSVHVGSGEQGAEATFPGECYNLDRGFRRFGGLSRITDMFKYLNQFASVSV